MPKDEELEIIKYALQEIKDQYQIYLDGFDDRKKKVQIFLVVCSLIITFPLSSEFLMERIISSQELFIALFIAGIIVLVSTIITSIYSIMDIGVRIPAYDDIINSIGKYKTTEIMKNVAEAYAKDLNLNIIEVDKKRRMIKIAEKFIIIGVLLISIPLIKILLFG